MPLMSVTHEPDENVQLDRLRYDENGRFFFEISLKQ